MLTDNQVQAVVNAVVEKATRMVDNRVNARSGSPTDKKKVKNAIAAALATK